MVLNKLSQNSKLNYWHLTSILGAALGLPAMIVGGELAAKYGGGVAFTSVCIGNLLVWLVGMGIISMAEQGNNSVDNIKNYLGKITGIIAAVMLIIAFLTWYMIQIKGIAIVINSILHKNEEINGQILRLGIFFGFFVATLSCGGIHLIKWICIISLPLLLLISIYIISSSSHPMLLQNNWGFSFLGVISVFITWLPGAVNLSTFFRHSRSKIDSVFALSFMTLIHIFFQFFCILMNFNNLPTLLSENIIKSDEIYSVIMVFFTILSFVCINLVNIYFASAGLEAILPHQHKTKRYFIIGLSGTLSYIFLQNYSELEFFEKIITTFIATLGIILIIDFLIKIIVKHRPRPLDKFFSSLCWFIGCIASLISAQSSDINHTLISGVSASLLTVMLIIFIEEMIWSIRNI